MLGSFRRLTGRLGNVLSIIRVQQGSRNHSPEVVPVAFVTSVRAAICSSQRVWYHARHLQMAVRKGQLFASNFEVFQSKRQQWN
eukprot:2828102-Amphidinium_carterae.1